MTGAMSGAVTAVPRAGRQQAARRRTAPIGPHGRTFKRCGSSPVCVREELEHRNAGNLPYARQHLVGALHARSPVTLRKKDRGTYAQVSAMCLLVAGLYGRRDTPERTLCRAATSCASSLAAGLFTAHADERACPCSGMPDYPAGIGLGSRLRRASIIIACHRKVYKLVHVAGSQ